MTTKPLPNRLKLTHAEYRVFPNDGRRHEILDGEHAASGAPGIRHQRVSRRLLRALDAAAEEHGVGEVFHGPVAVVLSEFDVVEPDLLFVAAERAAIIRRDEIKGAPDLVVEVLSPSSRRLDEIVKRKAYEDFGVQEYWIADPELETVKVYCRQGAGFGAPTELAAERGETLTTPLLPGFELPLQTVFSR